VSETVHLSKLSYASENARILSSAGWAGITNRVDDREVDDREYDVVRQLISELNLPY